MGKQLRPPKRRNTQAGAKVLRDPRIARENETIGGGYIVFRRGRNTGRVRAPEWPFEHGTREEAVAEAKRLAWRYPGQIFDVFELVQTEVSLHGVLLPAGPSKDAVRAAAEYAFDRRHD